MRTGVSGFQASRLVQARQALGLTQVALASLIDRSSSTISKWEKGSQEPEAIALAAISDVFNLSEKWFLKPIPNNGDATYFFRSNATATKSARIVAQIRLKWLQEISFCLQQWLDLPTVNVPHIQEENFQLITDEEIEKLADECRERWGLGQGPIDNVILSMESAGIVCTRDEIGYLKMDGVSHWQVIDNHPYVFLVSDKANGIRSRFDAAHELGHIVLHRSVKLKDFNKFHAEIERQAHRFAGAFLLPSESFGREVQRPTLDNFLMLKRRWKVSVAAMITRCLQLELIDDDYALRLRKGLSARGWRKGEPYDDKVSFESPRLLNRAVQMIVDQGVESKTGLLEDLGLPANMLENLCALPKGYFSQIPNANNVTNLKLKVKPANGSNHKTGGEVVSFPSKA